MIIKKKMEIKNLFLTIDNFCRKLNKKYNEDCVYRICDKNPRKKGAELVHQWKVSKEYTLRKFDDYLIKMFESPDKHYFVSKSRELLIRYIDNFIDNKFLINVNVDGDEKLIGQISQTNYIFKLLCNNNADYINKTLEWMQCVSLQKRCDYYLYIYGNKIINKSVFINIVTTELYKSQYKYILINDVIDIIINQKNKEFIELLIVKDDTNEIDDNENFSAMANLTFNNISNTRNVLILRDVEELPKWVNNNKNFYYIKTSSLKD